MGEISIPPAGSFPDSEKEDQLSVRLAAYDNQLDFLVNFYTLNVEFCTLERIKLILGLVKYIDWVRLSATSSSPMTAAMGSLVNQLRSGHDTLGAKVLTGIISTLSQLTGSIMADLKIIANFNRELYKLELGEMIGDKVPEGKIPTVGDIKKIFANEKPGHPFYSELAAEIIKEGFSPEGAAMREKVLKSMATASETKTAAATEKKEFTSKVMLIDGIITISAIASTLLEISEKLEENKFLLENRKLSMWDKIKRVFSLAFNKEPDATYYEVEFNDGEGKSVKKEVNFGDLLSTIERKAKNLSSASNPKRLEALPDEKLVKFLESSVKEARLLHKTINALDEYFKNTISQEDRPKIKGVKPELSTIKNAFVKAHEKYAEYLSVKDEEEQFKRLGINTSAG
jgi:hypothetical protein